MKKEKTMFSVILETEDFEIMKQIQMDFKFSTIQQVVRHLIYNPVSLHQYSEISKKKN
ncbi:MAG: hypothetical protein ACOYMA_19340 [Bacteroidia bacterium]